MLVSLAQKDDGYQVEGEGYRLSQTNQWREGPGDTVMLSRKLPGVLPF